MRRSKHNIEIQKILKTEIFELNYKQKNFLHAGN